MHMSQGSLGMLIKRYRAVLKKCHMLNMLGGTLLAGRWRWASRQLRRRKPNSRMPPPGTPGCNPARP